MTTTIHSLLEEFRQAAKSKRDLGDKFERLVAKLLSNRSLYIKDKYIAMFGYGWNGQVEEHNRITGIDLVAKERYTGDYCAIQCKFYDPGYTLQKSDIDFVFLQHPGNLHLPAG